MLDLRDAMTRLNRESTHQLRILYARATGRGADGVSRDNIIKALASRPQALVLDEPAAEVPAPSQERRTPAFEGAAVYADQEEPLAAQRARRVEKATSAKRRTGRA